MNANIQIRDVGDRLVITARNPRKVWIEVSALVVTATVGYGLIYRFFDWRISLALLVLLVAIEIARLSGSAVTATFSAAESVRRQAFLGLLSTRKTISMASIRWLEYREEQGGADTKYEPQGLYAVVGSGNTYRCLVPFLNAEEAEQAMIAIERKFPTLAERWKKDSPFRDHFTTLNLSSRS